MTSHGMQADGSCQSFEFVAHDRSPWSPDAGPSHASYPNPGCWDPGRQGDEIISGRLLTWCTTPAARPKGCRTRSACRTPHMPPSPSSCTSRHARPPQRRSSPKPLPRYPPCSVVATVLRWCLADPPGSHYPRRGDPGAGQDFPRGEIRSHWAEPGGEELGVDSQGRAPTV